MNTVQSRKRKFYLVLPLLALPFITLAFWAMGGGKEKSEDPKTTSGLNLQLPDAKLKDDKNADKLSFYKEADKDSLKRLEALRNDPDFKPPMDTSMNVIQLIPKSNNSMIQSPFTSGLDANEQKIYSKINELKKQISIPVETKPSPNPEQSAEAEKLQAMIQMMNHKQESDPEMDQLGGMLDKILDIQHPDRVSDQLKEKSVKNKQQVFSVQPFIKNDNISLMQSGRKDTIFKKRTHNSFFDLNTTLPDKVSEDPAIEAVVNETQTIVSGSTVKLRLTGDIYINGILIPKGNFIYGTAALENERLSVKISSIRYQNNLLPVSLEVYDMDGLAGIHIPGSISRDVSKQSAEQSLQSIQLATLDPSLSAQAASTGINAVKNLLNKKVKLVKVTLKAGYKILLKDNNNK